MRGREVQLVAASALGASAFLLPATSTPIEGDLSLHVFDPKNQIVRLPCSACVFPVKNGEESTENVGSADDTFWIQGGANDVILNLTVSDNQSLEVNGHPVYPMGDMLAMLAEPVHVIQVPASASQKEIADGSTRSMSLEVTGASIGMERETEVTPMGDVLSSFRYSIFGLQSNMVNLDDVIVDLLKTADGELLIMDARTEPSMAGPAFSVGEEFTENGRLPFPPPMAVENSEQLKCGSLPIPVCRLVNMIEAKVSHIKSVVSGKKPGCGGRRPHQMPGHIKPGFLRGGPRPDMEAEEPQPPHPFPGHHHHKHHGHRRHHSFFHSLARGFIAVVIPTLAGVAVGMFISVIGLIVGRLIGFIWTTFVRGGRRGYASVALDDADAEENVDAAEKTALLNESVEEAPPVYEDAPAYEQEKATQ